MYKLRKIFALFLAIVLATSFSTVAFAAENEVEIPANAIRHEVTLEVAADGTIGSVSTTNSDGDYSVMPCAWWQHSYTISSDAMYTPTFTIPDRYFAYEMSATTSSGGTLSSNYRVELIYHAGSVTVASGGNAINGSTYKVDHIEVDAGSKYLFKISNFADVSIIVNLTYYSWA